MEKNKENTWLHVKNKLDACKSQSEILYFTITHLISDIEDILEQLPEQIGLQYLKDLHTIIHKINIENTFNAEHIKAINALNFEKEQALKFIKQGIIISATATKIQSKQLYKSYDKKITTKQALLEMPVKENKIAIQNDVPMLKSHNGQLLPYIYETKYYPTTKFGTRGKDLNQLLKYQKAYELGLISGITVDIQGSISSEFIMWVKNHKLLTNVQFIYSLKLPSNTIYKFEIMPVLGTSGIQIENNENYTQEDIQYITKMNDLFKTDSYLDIINTAMSPNDVPDEYQKALVVKINNEAKWIEEPYEIRNINIYLEYVKAQEKYRQTLINTTSHKELHPLDL